MVVAELSITPIGKDEMKPFVDAAVSEIQKSGLKYEVDAMSTTIEGELEEILNVVKKTHNAVKAIGADRLLIELRIDDKSSGVTINEEVSDYRVSV